MGQAEPENPRGFLLKSRSYGVPPVVPEGRRALTTDIGAAAARVHIVRIAVIGYAKMLRPIANVRFEEAAPQRRNRMRMSCVDGSCIARDFCDCDGPSVQSCVRPVFAAVATGPDEFREQGSYRLNDL
jgi:hypothetical protein